MSRASTVTSKGQTTIPKEIRDRMGLKTGDRVAFIVRGEEVVLRTVKGTLLDLRGAIAPRRRPEDLDAVRREVRKAVGERAARRVGKA
jgi:AbrB family looped-hinge helix DNA binding protein